MQTNIKPSKKPMMTTKMLVILALLAALSFVLEKFLGIDTMYFKLHFGYLPVAAAGMLFGMIPALMGGVIVDILGNLQYFNIFFVLLAALGAAAFAFFLHSRKEGKKEMIMQAVLCQLFISIVVQMGLNTLLLWLLYHSFNPIRFLITVLVFPIKVFSLYLLLKYRKAFETYIA